LKENAEVKEERVLLLESWKKFESDVGNEEQIAKVDKLLPKRIKKKRQIKTDDGANAGWEEYYDYIFPEEEAETRGLKILQRAHLWKKRKITESESK